jgi:Tol biopolymer transport system component
MVLGGALVVAIVATVAGVWLLWELTAPLRDEPHGAVYVLDVHTQELRKVSGDGAGTVVWTPDGESIWYTDAGIPGTRGTSVKSVEVASRKRHTVVGLGHGGFVSMAPAAGLVAYATGDRADLTVRVASVDGQRRTFGPGTYPRLSRDGQHLLFLMPVCHSQTVEVAEPLMPNSVSTLTDGGVDWAHWFDNERAVYEKEITPGSFDGHAATQSVTARFVQQPGEEARPALAYEWAPMISPDGRFAVYSLNQGGDMVLRDLTAGVEINLGRGFASGDWSPDSQMFVVRLRPNGNAAGDVLQVFSRDGTKVFSVDEGTMKSREQRYEFVNDIAWSPDGSKLAIGVMGGGSGYPPCGS